ncbi:polysaccharide deacetylase [Bacteroidales bacterium]|nr:polysaccharide deacetylase [Bacteroidales bacterium]
MLIEQPPLLYRAFFPGAIWRIDSSAKNVFLTFDDGPIPHITPWVLDILDCYQIKATFFCVGDNVRKHPEIYQMILDRGHTVGNHTFSHVQGLPMSSKSYMDNVIKAEHYIKSEYFRPPHGHLRFSQYFKLRKRYKVIMWDVVTRDYSKRMTAQGVFNVVKKKTRNGSIIVFHDSLKAKERIKVALPLSIEWLLAQGYTFQSINI